MAPKFKTVTMHRLVCLLVAWIPSATSLAHDQLVTSREELNRAIQGVRPGDTIRLAAGRWEDVELTIKQSGTADAPITLAAVETSATVLTGHTRLRIGGQHVVVRGLAFEGAWHEDAIVETRADSKLLGQNCLITECVFRDCNPPDLNQDSKYLSLYGQGHRIEYCEFEGKRNRGTTVVVWFSSESGKGQLAAGHRFYRNYFGPRERLGKNGGETIRIGDSKTSLQSAKCIVTENLFEQCNGEAEIISNKSCDNVYEHNTFRRCSGALTLRHGHRCRVEGNYFLGEGASGTGGVRIIGEQHVVMNNYMSGLKGDDTRAAISLMNGLVDSPLNGYSPVVGAQVLLNTIVNCRQSIVVGLQDADDPGSIAPVDCLIAGNLVTGDSEPLVRGATFAAGLRFTDNCFFGAATGVALDGTNLNANPQLAADSVGILKPSSANPMHGHIQKQWTNSATHRAIDIEGQPRELPWDIGSDELSDQPPKFRPLLRSDVGLRSEEQLRAKDAAR